MGVWSRFNAEILEESENKLIEYSGASIIPENIFIGKGLHLYCLKCGSPENPPLLLLHGYGGCGLIFYKIIKELSRKYYLLIVDHLGMGRSSRPEFTPTNTNDTENFFVEAIELFRISLQLEQFVLAGHSFGGYIAACYAIKYSSRVSKILFLSTVGIPTPPKDYDFCNELKGDWKFR